MKLSVYLSASHLIQLSIYDTITIKIMFVINFHRYFPIPKRMTSIALFYRYTTRYTIKVGRENNFRIPIKTVKIANSKFHWNKQNHTSQSLCGCEGFASKLNCLRSAALLVIKF